MTAESEARVQAVLRLGDSALVLAQRLCEWVGKGPALEEDMALSNIGLDLLGQARLWLSYAGELEGRGRDEDQLAFLRDTHEFRSLLLVERPNGNYADTLVRQFFFDTAHQLMLQGLKGSADLRIAEIAAKALKEVHYHLRRSGDLIVRLGDGTAESHTKTQAAIDELWMYTGEMFTDDAVDQAMAAAGLMPLPSTWREAWLDHVGEVLAEGTLKMPPAGAWMQSGGRQGRHTEALGFLLAEMQYLQRAHPGAVW